VTTEKPKYGIDRALQRVHPYRLAEELGLGKRRVPKWIKDDPASALQKCAEAAGSQVALARILGVSQRTISVWIAADLPNREAKQPGNAVERAVAAAGGQPAMAEALGVTQQSVSEWCKQGYVPAARAQEIEHTWGVSRVELLAPKLRNALGAGGEL
jgi:DNA-binding transcriptional regulator YdaS (Cro superfamily)